VDLSTVTCPGATGTVSGDVCTVNMIACAPDDGTTTTYKSGTLTLDGDTLTVDESSTLTNPAKGIDTTSTVTGTLTKS
jgi:hypothetical protein